ncbi:hypothetical protein HEN79_017755, partial [Escherichia coli]|nr:hypothetical protein [Escherichia coli]
NRTNRGGFQFAAARLPWFTKGLRLGNMPQIRVIVDEELESVWTGKKTPQQALDTAVERGNQLLRRFEKSTKS